MSTDVTASFVPTHGSAPMRSTLPPAAHTPNPLSRMADEKNATAQLKADLQAGSVLEKALQGGEPVSTKKLIDSLVKQEKFNVIESSLSHALATNASLDFTTQATQYALETIGTELSGKPFAQQSKVDTAVKNMRQRIAEGALSEHLIAMNIGAGHQEHAIAIVKAVYGDTDIDDKTSKHLEALLKKNASQVVDNLAGDKDIATRNQRQLQMAVIQKEYDLPAAQIAQAVEKSNNIKAYTPEQNAALTVTAQGMIKTLRTNPDDVRPQAVRQLKTVGLEGQTPLDQSTMQAISIVTADTPKKVNSEEEAQRIGDQQAQARALASSTAYQNPASGRKIISYQVQEHLTKACEKGDLALADYANKNLNDRIAQREKVKDLIENADLDTKAGREALFRAFDANHIERGIGIEAIKAHVMQTLENLKQDGTSGVITPAEYAIKLTETRDLMQKFHVYVDGNLKKEVTASYAMLTEIRSASTKS